ncbi:redox-sensing transcriptional repressor Rex [Aneurinibacillus thermoaerophilus]|uniref:Redox-sensing transcriptional repressor Rex n=1 Tax=Aneurinibacillus thermoaerophilus TaxID=143495 RepID=A0ABX8YG17_ANETH|nr:MULTISPECIES: redox-sensing transcriptional repressor Rex [Aneurinibacillus]MED0679676.1 redox-sensing transcriptional repressor Rex [Aneurinibacillus thermoaerophilus]MED0737327.1 redox-sensing transcriptional repressor Rex [Aneurinibacillus thermoaerophilus]MED0756175.1 redox-sensing transcriptional repressor Rex [Aneurinibacillus thermoaerophilus]MED0760390.1 redox-sensing transcriptional repressor Rex [Aneurinibacillus thermoaerophilus]MED0764898.1 redox-sensing transcriptional represso
MGSQEQKAQKETARRKRPSQNSGGKVRRRGQKVKVPKISEAVVRRLPVYLRYLNNLKAMNVRTVSSQQLGEALDLNPAQIRKDLACFGEFGRKGIGYEVNYLVEKIKSILKLDKQVNVLLVGAGHLGHAISNYNAYLKDSMRIVAIFDADPHKIGKKIVNMMIQPLEELANTVKEKNIRIAIIAVPADAAQAVADRLVAAGITGILNFAPTNLRVPENVRVHDADVTMELHSLAYYL